MQATIYCTCGASLGSVRVNSTEREAILVAIREHGNMAMWAHWEEDGYHDAKIMAYIDKSEGTGIKERK